MKAFLGIDTSCYTTSVAAVLENGEIIDYRTPIPVKQGAVGIRQQEAVFLHVKALPDLVRNVMEDLRKTGYDAVGGIGYSYAPTTREGSYMPVFVPGATLAQSLASALECNSYGFSHQQGHIRAAQGWEELPDQFLALHVSGGTTEILRVEKEAYQISVIGGSKDISAGQTIDRVGVALGLPFPAGPHLEKLCEGTSHTQYRFHTKDMGGYFSLSGIESAAQRLISQGVPQGELALGIFQSIGKILCRSILHCIEETGLNTVLFSGGVCSNGILRSVIKEELKQASVFFGAPRLCSDNAVGAGILCKEAVCSEN